MKQVAADMCARESAIGRADIHSTRVQNVPWQAFNMRTADSGVVSSERCVVAAIRRWPNGMHDA
jgi:hypothetical protein